jgi:hypothetical protein
MSVIRYELYVSCYKLRAYVKLVVKQNDRQNIESLFYFALWAVADPSVREV